MMRLHELGFIATTMLVVAGMARALHVFHAGTPKLYFATAVAAGVLSLIMMFLTRKHPANDRR